MNASWSLDTLYLPRPARLTAHISSRLRSPDIKEETVHAVLAEYGLELTGRPQNMPNARRNRNLIVHTQMGRKVLKLYRADWRPETIAHEHSILRHLAQMDSPAPRLLATASGKTAIAHGSNYYCVFDFVKGMNYSFTFLLRAHRMQLMRAAARTLAQLHLRLLDFVPLGRHHLGFISRKGQRVRDVDWHIKRVVELKERSQSLSEPASDWLTVRGFSILDNMTELDEALQNAQLPITIIHGDFGLHNLIFQSAKQATPMDFELARLEWRLSDLVSCLSKLRNRAGNYDMGSVREFLAAYQVEYPIGDEEWHWFPLVWKNYKLAKAVQYWSSYFETNGPARKLSLARDAAEQAGWLTDHPDMVREMRSGMLGE